MTTPKVRPTPLGPPKGKSPYNVQAVKHYVFNETGNIMMSTTDTSSDQIQQSVRSVFEEVSVFFAALTKAMESAGDSLFDQEAIQKIVDGSGMFVHVTQEEVNYNMQGASMTFSKDLLEALLGLATGAGEMGFASAMISEIGKQGIAISEGTSKSSSKVGNIVFVCEYILGLPIVSAIVVYADVTKNKEWFKVGPCISGNAVQQALVMTKDTYLFVVPAAIKKYAGDLDSVSSDADYQALIKYLEGILVSGAAPIFGPVYPTGNTTQTAVQTLTLSTSGNKPVLYQLTGQNFGLPNHGRLNLHGAPSGTDHFEIVNWTDTDIIFTAIKASPPGVPTAIDLFTDNNTAAKPAGTTTTLYTIK